MLKHSVIAIVAVVFGIGISSPARADIESVHTAHASGDDNNVGLGIMIGALTGVTAKFYANRHLAFDLGLGSAHDDFHYHHQGIMAQGDVLWHPALLVSNASLALPLYVGLGARAGSHDRPNNMSDDFVVGARMPVGLALEFVHFPADIFFEIAPSLDFVGDEGANFFLGGALGSRIFF